MFRMFSLAAAVVMGGMMVLGVQHGWEPGRWLQALVALYAGGPTETAAEVRQLKSKLRTVEAEARDIADQRQRLRGNQEADLQVLAQLEQNVGCPDADPVARKALDLITCVRDKELARLDTQLQAKNKALKEARSTLVATQLEEVRKTLGDPPARPVRLEAESQRKEVRLALLRQWDLLRDGQVQALRMCFAESVRSRITFEAVQAGKDLFKHEPIADLMHEVVVDEETGKASVLTSRGRLFTTLVRQQGRWIGDRVWFE